jgi:hypothetical protein
VPWLCPLFSPRLLSSLSVKLLLTAAAQFELFDLDGVTWDFVKEQKKNKKKEEKKMGLTRIQRSMLLCGIASLAIAQSVWAGSTATATNTIAEKALSLEGIEEGLQVFFFPHSHFKPPVTYWACARFANGVLGKN